MVGRAGCFQDGVQLAGMRLGELSITVNTLVVEQSSDFGAHPFDAGEIVFQVEGALRHSAHQLCF